MLEFTKMSGSGNDFLVIDNRAGAVKAGTEADFARRVCPRGPAVGADGVLLLEKSAKADFRMRIINADGSEAEMCGNGARCIAVFAHAIGAAGKEMSFETLAGIIRGYITPNGSKVQLTDAARPRAEKDVPFCGLTKDIYFTNTGVPHAVLPVDDLEKVQVVEWGRAIRRHERFAPAGTNANFIAREGDGIAVRTYERGVEDETLACGTGSTASALAAHVLWNLPSPNADRTRGGTILNIHFKAEGSLMTGVHLEGPAEIVYYGKLPG